MDSKQQCPCGSQINYIACCQRIHLAHDQAFSAEQLMRARYSAFVVQDIDFIYKTFHPSTRSFQNKKDIEQWAKESKWMQLIVISSTPSTVIFEAHYLDPDLQVRVHREHSTFKKEGNLWFYVDGILD